MKMIFKQRLLTWLDGYKIYDEGGSLLFKVEGKISFGHRLHIYNSKGKHIATVKEKIIDLLPEFKLYVGRKNIGTLRKKITLLRPAYKLASKGWTAEGDFFEFDYEIKDSKGSRVAYVDKVFFRLSDTYEINVENPENALCVLMMVLAIDAEKCSRKRKEERDEN